MSGAAEAIKALQRELAAEGLYPGRIDGEFGPLTLAAQMQACGAPAYLRLAAAEYGVSEIYGRRDNPRIRAYHAATSLGDAADEVPWCSSFVNWCMGAAGVAGTGSAAARSWLDWGRPSSSWDVDAIGAVCVLARGAPPAGHVGFLVHRDDGRVWLLGGNQDDRVKVSVFGRYLLLGCRVPIGGGRGGRR